MIQMCQKCAFCGEPLHEEEESSIEMAFGLPGAPVVRWHWETPQRCSTQDPLFRAFMQASDREALQQLEEIQTRGPGRVLLDEPARFT
ncbi:MAG: hypothetical protein ACKOBW_04725 [Planctomycetota bacterium]